MNNYDATFLASSILSFASTVIFAVTCYFLLARFWRWCARANDKKKAECRRIEIEKLLRVRAWTGGLVPVDCTGAATGIIAQGEDPSDTANARNDNSNQDSGEALESSCGDALSDEEGLEEHVFDCAICLASFEEDDLICESNNRKCRHLFHKACMASWLLRHDECPICREKYLVATAALEIEVADASRDEV